MGTSLTKGFNEQTNGCACLFEILMHFVGVHCQTTQNSQILHTLNAHMSQHGKLLNQFLKLNTTLHIQKTG